MSDEKKIDLSSFDGIADRVARAKAKSEAIRAARAAGDAHPAPAVPPPEAPPPEAEAAPETVQESAPAEKAEARVDLSNLDAITDRVARAKAKAEAIRAARAAGGAHPAPAPERKPRREVSAEAMAAKKAQAKAARDEAAAPAASTAPPPGGNGALFYAGMTVRRNGKLARVIAARYENVCLVYEDSPGETVMTKRYRLAVEMGRGTLQFASAHEFTATIPPSAGKFGRTLAFLGAAGLTGAAFLGIGYLIGPLNLFPTMLIGYVLFALAYHLTK